MDINFRVDDIGNVMFNGVPISSEDLQVLKEKSKHAWIESWTIKDRMSKKVGNMEIISTDIDIFIKCKGREIRVSTDRCDNLIVSTINSMNPTSVNGLQGFIVRKAT